MLSDLATGYGLLLSDLAGDSFIFGPTDPDRVFTVAQDNRTLTVPAENRTLIAD